MYKQTKNNKTSKNHNQKPKPKQKQKKPTNQLTWTYGKET